MPAGNSRLDGRDIKPAQKMNTAPGEHRREQPVLQAVCMTQWNRSKNMIGLCESHGIDDALRGVDRARLLAGDLRQARRPGALQKQCCAHHRGFTRIGDCNRMKTFSENVLRATGGRRPFNLRAGDIRRNRKNSAFRAEYAQKGNMVFEHVWTTQDDRPGIGQRSQAVREIGNLCRQTRIGNRPIRRNFAHGDGARTIAGVLCKAIKEDHAGLMRPVRVEVVRAGWGARRRAKIPAGAERGGDVY